MIHVITKFDRPPQEAIDNFRKIAVATVYEASGRKGQVDSLIKPLRRGLKICGPAFTVQCHPKDNLMLHKALQKASPGDILITTTGQYYQAGYWGDLMTTSAIARKLGGLAIDGCIRDSEEIIESGFPVFCRGFSITGTVKNTLGLINHPIIFGGTVVNPGDIVLGDDDGMVIVDRSKCDEIYASSAKRVEKEIQKAELLKTGKTSVELNKLDKIFDALGMQED
ncbi:MAG: 4-carboxy-4-hydroxy-2-oxoadipate aldolase/oxaloacetate decarboxylase [Desulfobacterales bacterium]|nr:4-carboxy-4-hydroxy-2-oxoadipate aldolase/oxaloacetate decarboxylase [Desulfobacterales bacterium]